MKRGSFAHRFWQKLHMAMIGNKTLGRIMMRVWPRMVQRDAEDLFDLVSGFVYSQVLFAVVKLDVLQHLKKKPAIWMNLHVLRN